MKLQYDLKLILYQDQLFKSTFNVSREFPDAKQVKGSIRDVICYIDH